MQLLQELRDRLENIEKLGTAMPEVRRAVLRVQDSMDRLQHNLGNLLTALNTLSPDEEAPAAAAETRTLRDHVTKVLGESNEPLTVALISDLVLANGYTTKAKNKLNFQRQVHEILQNSTDTFRRYTRKNTRPIRYCLR